MDDLGAFLNGTETYDAGSEASGPRPPGVPSDDGPPRGLPIIMGPMLIDAHLFHLIEMIINCVIINILSVFGCTGNVLTIYILCQHGIRNSSTNIVLLSLAVADFLLLVTMPLRKVSLIVEYFDKALAITVDSYVVSCNYLTLNRVWSLISHSHVVIIAVERFLAVYFPFKTLSFYHQWIANEIAGNKSDMKKIVDTDRYFQNAYNDVSVWVTPTRMAVVVICTHIIWYLLLIPLFAMFDLRWITDFRLNQTVAVPGFTDFFIERESTIVFYNSFVVNLASALSQIVIVLVCSIAVVARVLSFGRKRKLMTKENIFSGTTKESANGDSCSESRTTSSYTGLSSTDSPAVVAPKPVSTGDKKEISSNKGSVSDREMSSATSSDQASSVTTISHNKPATSQSKKLSSRIDLKVVRMLLVVCFVYLIFVFPTFLLFVFQYVFDELRTPYWSRVNFIATSINMMFLAVNSSANFVIYVVTSQKFYTSFKNMFRKA